MVTPITVSISGSTVYVRRGSDGSLVSSSSISTPETAIQAAINEGPGWIYIDSGTYNMSGSFTGLKIDKSFTRVTMAPDARLMVPAGFNGALFSLNTVRHAEGYIHGTSSSFLYWAPQGYQKVILEGGFLGDQQQATSQTRGWVGIRMFASVHGTFQNVVRDTYIAHCDTGIQLMMDDASPDPTNQKANQWLNGNLFDNIWIFDFDVGVDFKVHANVTPTAGHGGFYRNVFRHVTLQAGSNSTPRIAPRFGFRNVRHAANAFYDCMPWDFGSATRGHIHSSATNTLIVGGYMAGGVFEDNGLNTKIYPPLR